MSKTSLVIVESPAKCKKIESYLGPGYKCLASFGHLRQLKSLNNIDFDNNFKPTFEIVDDSKKQKHIDFLRKEIASSDEVVLATDDDREGEAIAWHICDLFDLPVTSTKRIVFHEITENAIQTAMAHPRTIDMQKVNSQIARQILDLLVGYNISPILWKFISKTTEHSLSAGRCQTPALKLVYENQKEIDASPAQKVYNTTGYFSSKCIPFELNKHFDNENQMTEFLEESANFSHVYTRTNPERVYKQSPEPLTTSRIQQLASNELHISPKETMRCCQTLYEAGYITYMRTDSKKYCVDFIDTIKKYIVQLYLHEKYISPTIDTMSNTELKTSSTTTKTSKTTKPSTTTKPSKTKSNIPPPQEAHEAIRPTNISMQLLPQEMSAREKKLYKLIWETTMESCMSPAEYFSFTGTITTHLSDVIYQCKNELLDFPGWKIVKNKDKSNQEKIYNYLLQITQNKPIHLVKITSNITLKNNKMHYTEAKLVQLLEDHGIGRPSTFSTLIDKIQERGYVKKMDIPGKQISCKEFELQDDVLTETNTTKEFGNEKNKLVIQPVGILVIEFLEKNFSTIFDYDYTKHMEDNLDRICKGDMIWHQVCDMCQQEINTSCEKLADEKKCEIKIDDTHYYIIGKHGPVIKCIEEPLTTTSTIKTGKKNNVSFLPVKEGIDIKKLERGEYTLQEIIAPAKQGQIHLGTYKMEPLFLKKGKFGLYVTWGQNSKSLSCFGNRPMENVTLDDVLTILEPAEQDTNTNTNTNTNTTHTSSSSGIIRFITKDISIRQGKYGDYVFYKTSKMSKPLFLKLDKFEGDYKTCTIKIFLEWLKAEHNIS